MKAVVIGAGLTGLAAAIRLHQAGHEVQVLEATDRPGGRLKTDSFEGFRLDHGFQVAFTAYPTLAKLVPENSQSYRAFESGALLWDGSTLHEVNKDKPLTMALSGYLPLSDKLRVLKLNALAASLTEPQIFARPDQSAETFLKEFGFSDFFLSRFARPFFGGIFLDRSLATSSRMFLFIWKMLNEGRTVIPALGIAEIAQHLVSQLPNGSIKTLTRVTQIESGSVTLESGDVIKADHILVATEAPAAEKLTGVALPSQFKSSVCVYFAARKPVVNRPVLILNATAQGMVNEVVPVSEVSPELAPSGQHLLSVTLLGQRSESDEELSVAIKRELAPWFPAAEVDSWRLLRVMRVTYAQMDQPPGREPVPHQTPTPGVWIAGEFNTHSSINGALDAGISAAEAIIGASR